MTENVQTSGVPRLLDALCDALRGRDELHGVQVTSGPLSGSREPEGIELWTADDEQETKTTGRRRESTITIEGQCYAIRPGSGETVIRDARDRAFVLAGQIETALRESLLGTKVADEAGDPTVREAYVTSLRLRQGANAEEHIALIDFTIVARRSLILY